jgi:4-hydroxy-tetrahydrodipicolinate reductase
MQREDRVIPVIIVGARGRMGRALIHAVMASDDLTLSAAVDRSEGPGLGQDAGRLAGTVESGIVVTGLLAPRRGQVVVDFSLPTATAANLQRCVDAGVPFVCGTTGLDDAAEAAMRDAAAKIPIVFAANFSVGVTILNRIAATAAAALGAGWDSEIVEIHHRHKRDAPSGTALRLGHAIAEATDRQFSEVFVSDRSERHEARSDDEIGVMAVRGGDSIGEHTVYFFGEGERLELTHRATSRAIFAHGALRAARWVVDRPPGLYDMVDVLELT